jgi:hypothetical protein
LAQPWCKGLEDYSVVAEGATRRVVMHHGLAKEFGKAKAQDKAKLLSWIQIWCDKPEGSIPAEKLKSQEHFTDAKGRKVHIFALKAHQARLYGFIRVVQTKETFLFASVDPSKKDDSADPAVIKRAKNEAFRVLDVLGIR